MSLLHRDMSCLKTQNKGVENMNGGVYGTPDPYHSFTSRSMRNSVPKEQSSQSRMPHKLHLRSGYAPDQFVKDPPGFILQVLSDVMKNPSIESQIAKDVVKRVQSKPKWLDTQSIILVISPVLGLARIFISLRSP